MELPLGHPGGRPEQELPHRLPPFAMAVADLSHAAGPEQQLVHLDNPYTMAERDSLHGPVDTSGPNWQSSNVRLSC